MSRKKKERGADMKAHKCIITVLLVLAFLSASRAYSAEISVQPGAGTLELAISSASNGDTLVLQDGEYTSALESVIIDKSLIIRVKNRSVNSVVSVPVHVDGNGISVTIQGLKFTADLVLTRAASVRVLQNYFVGAALSVANYRTEYGDGELIVIGNNLGQIGSTFVDNAYIAGNISANINVAASAWVVGNKVSGTITASSANARIIGNRIYCGYNCIQSSGSFGLIANNIILPSGKYTSSGLNDAISTGSYSSIHNNVIALLSGSRYQIDAMKCGGNSEAKGNIVYGEYPYLYPSTGCSASDSMCLGCGTSLEGFLDADPQFADYENFEILATSPAINAGPSDFELADLDRSRNDMGAYGGPWSIGQYDVQRDPSNYSPYVYPLFTGGAAFSGGTLNLKALGVAKLR